MKTTVLLFCAAFLACTAQQVSAKIWRVNNNSNYDGSSKWGDNFGGTASKPVFKQLSDANNSNLVSATAGDTVHLEGSNIQYNGPGINKKLVIIGPGYFLNENPNVSNDALSASIDWIDFNDGSAGSQLLGVYVSGGYGISINTSDILIKRCRIDYSITLHYDIADVSIIQNYFSNVSNNTSSAINPSGYNFPSHFIFDNNICKKTLLLVSNSTTYTAQEVNNNTFDCPAISGSPSIQLNTASFKNNILKTSSATAKVNTNNTNNVSYCVSSSSTGQFGTANNNIVVTNISSIFVTPGTSDGAYQLKSGSVASNNGSDKTDRGAFGGIITNRYTLSGLPPVPVIYQFTTGVASQSAGLPVTIKARTIK